MFFLVSDHRVERKFLRFWFPVILYSGIIFYASSLPYVQSSFEIVHLDKAVHILEYLLFGFLLARAFCYQWSWLDGAGKVSSWVRTWGIVALGSLLYGLSDEYHQSFVPGRESALSDVIADVIGGLLGAYIYSLWTDRMKQKNH